MARISPCEMCFAVDAWDVVRREFSDIPDVAQIVVVLVRLSLAAVLGALLGYQREAAGAAAGLRTHILVSLGSAIFILVPLQAGMALGDLSRVLQGLLAGVGFLGAGAVLKRSDNGEIMGLTTAANIWVTAAIGTAVGMGRETTALVSTVFALIVLEVLARLPIERGKRAEDRPSHPKQKRPNSQGWT